MLLIDGVDDLKDPYERGNSHAEPRLLSELAFGRSAKPFERPYATAR
jgi:hypothetical protein